MQHARHGLRCLVAGKRQRGVCGGGNVARWRHSGVSRVCRCRHLLPSSSPALRAAHRIASLSIAYISLPPQLYACLLHSCYCLPEQSYANVTYILNLEHDMLRSERQHQRGAAKRTCRQRQAATMLRVACLLSLSTYRALTHRGASHHLTNTAAT